MEPILSKQEIADLLRAIREGKVSLDLEKSGQKHISKPCTPVNLFQVNSMTDELARLPNFDIVLDNFCQHFGITLTNNLQRTFSIKRTTIESSQFNDFLIEIKDSGAIGVIDLSPLKHGALIFVNTQMCFTLIEIMLGASTEIDHLQLDRKLTTIELSIVNSILSKCCDDMDRAFSQLVNMKSSLLKVESNSRLVSITEPDADILIGTFTISVGEETGTLHLVFPQTTLDPLRESLKDLLNVNKAKQGLWAEVLQSELQDIYLELIAQSGTMEMSVDEILSLKRGDIVPINYNPNKPLSILIEKTPKFTAIPGSHGGKKAISITSVFDEGA